MKQTLTASPRALVLLAATALSSTPAFAQDAAPPPVSATVAAPAPAAQAAPAPAATGAPVFAPRQEVVQPLPVRPQPVATPEPEAETAAATPRRAARQVAARPAAARPAAVARTAAPAAAAVATPADTAPAPVAEAPAAVTPSAPVAEPTPPVAADPVTTEQTATTETTPWLWIVGGAVALLALLGVLFGRRRRRVEEVYEEPAYVPPAAVSVAAPVSPPVTEPVAVLADTDERPWIRMTLQPTATETRDDEQVMTYDLIVENEGPVAAKDVRVSSFLLTDRDASPMEASLIDSSALRRRIDVAAGGSVQVAGSVILPEGSEARIVADARYPLPNGGEGHLAARFAVDTESDQMTTRVDKVLDRV